MQIWISKFSIRQTQKHTDMDIDFDIRICIHIHIKIPYQNSIYSLYIIVFIHIYKFACVLINQSKFKEYMVILVSSIFICLLFTFLLFIYIERHHFPHPIHIHIRIHFFTSCLSAKQMSLHPCLLNDGGP